LRPLAVSGARRSPALPEVPTVAESGVAGFESSAGWGLSAPSGTPRDAIMKLNGEMRAVLQTPQIVEKMLANGVEPRHGTPEEFTALLRAEWEQRGIIVQRIGFKAE
ncbi:MAG: Bug family tripartite tricarboxylate transporter substrate binding protein, partial [Burkholderiales bacterium]